ncbi:MAG: TraR/DksA family transcriptional regulator [Proteobacteria bacterium]|nr:TraR/DksA family transcriptional regulator [Pseudomonadota bacterium]
MEKPKLDLKKIKKILLKQKEELEKDMKGNKAPISEHEESTFADANDLATHDTDLSNDLSVKQLKVNQYNEILDALERIENPDFGICEECGIEIGAKRLEVYPATRLCIACQEEYERTLKAKNLISSVNPTKSSE